MKEKFVKNCDIVEMLKKAIGSWGYIVDSEEDKISVRTYYDNTTDNFGWCWVFKFMDIRVVQQDIICSTESSKIQPQRIQLANPQSLQELRNLLSKFENSYRKSGYYGLARFKVEK